MLKHNLHFRMVKAGLTAAELARKVGCTPAYISLILHGHRQNPSVKTLMALAAALECSVDDLLDGDHHDARAC